MRKKSIKEFWEEYKGELIICGCFVGAVVGGVLIGRGLRPTVNVPEDVKEFAGFVGKACSEANSYTYATRDEIVKAIGKDVVTCGPNGEKLEVTAALLFGNKVET